MTVLDDLRHQVGDDILTAADTLSAFILDAADRTAEQVGFGYVLVPDAPNTFHSLSQAYARSVATGEPLPISSENSDDVIYTPASVNGALRFWHDVNHVRRQLDFGLVDELELSLWHLGELEKAGHPAGSLVWRLLHADLTGQAYVQAFARRFPFDQRRFVTGCVTAGFDHGLLAELRQQNAP
ncbi:hypothetical protein PP348_20300 [Mycobacteroides abscessus]|uniref:hypothetical protein n=1 Tax=Mycobacteroides abscessus TaxID=36809 RepID=UPI0021065266|nr:hypothetical protein [Mycobacteroides abscessus]MDM2096418.1 hypothetical protein [Mycobacteroides abscessus]MDM2121149.1 hypothetical protein [Mycobacteroides abscessus]MDM2124356.1 hypothetical protein [Mycobacteroides abscessus]MDM2130541.1 hypothetical protein [Mycobacteroides abscessus]MDM2203070.1 hypothetical protein [Mycobacteroides abscessus]